MRKAIQAINSVVVSNRYCIPEYSIDIQLLSRLFDLLVIQLDYHLFLIRQLILITILGQILSFYYSTLNVDSYYQSAYQNILGIDQYLKLQF